MGAMWDHVGFMQIEESYIGAEEFCRLAKQDEQTVLRNELTVLKGLNFDLITYAPYRSINGFLAVHLDSQPPSTHPMLYALLVMS
jgi:hypothetical protein